MEREVREVLGKAAVFVCASWLLTVAVMGAWAVGTGELSWLVIPVMLIPQAVVAAYALAALKTKDAEHAPE